MKYHENSEYTDWQTYCWKCAKRVMKRGQWKLAGLKLWVYNKESLGNIQGSQLMPFFFFFFLSYLYLCARVIKTFKPLPSLHTLYPSQIAYFIFGFLFYCLLSSFLIAANACLSLFGLLYFRLRRDWQIIYRLKCNLDSTR